MPKESTEELEQVFAEEAFVVEVQGLLHDIMVAKGISRAELARQMGVSRARITQLFSADCKNFTVRILARAMHALGEEPVLTTNDERLNIAGISQRELIASFAESGWETKGWQELPRFDDAEPCFGANDNIFGGLGEMRRRRSTVQFEEKAAA